MKYETPSHVPWGAIDAHRCSGLGLLPLPSGETGGVRGQVSLDGANPLTRPRKSAGDLSPRKSGLPDLRTMVRNPGKPGVRWRGEPATRPYLNFYRYRQLGLWA